jgi:hypothetical protein
MYEINVILRNSVIYTYNSKKAKRFNFLEKPILKKIEQIKINI